VKCLLRRSIPYSLAIAVLAVRLSSAPTVSIAAASNLLPVLEALRAAWIAAEPGLVEPYRVAPPAHCSRRSRRVHRTISSFPPM
jgi:hypothetical protein